MARTLTMASFVLPVVRGKDTVYLHVAYRGRVGEIRWWVEAVSGAPETETVASVRDCRNVATNITVLHPGVVCGGNGTAEEKAAVVSELADLIARVALI